MNLFELFVKIGVDDQASGKLSELSGKLGNGLKNAAKIGTAAVGAAAAGITALTTQAVKGFAEYEQLAGGAQKIFDQMDYSKIAADANNAYKELGLSANQYLAVINDVGATFAATMGDEAGYEAAKTGLKAISDYASGTGKNVDLLSEKFTLITRSTSSYQSIADQFSGILPATSDAFLEQAQAAGILSGSYTKLTEVPIAEYQAAVSQMLERGVKDLGLFNNTANEAFSTLSGSLTMTKKAWENLVVGIADDNADIELLIDNLVESADATAKQLVPRLVKILSGLGTAIEQLVPILSAEIPELLSEVVPPIIGAASQLIVALATGLIVALPELAKAIPEIVGTVVKTFQENWPAIQEAGGELLGILGDGILTAIPVMIAKLPDLITALVNFLSENAPKWVESGFEFISQLAFGIIAAIPDLISNLPELITAIVDFFVSALPVFIEKGGELIGNLIIGILGAIPEIVASVPDVIKALVDGLSAGIDAIKDVGKNLIAGLWEGIQEKIEWLKSKITGVVDGIKELFTGEEGFDTHSPSKWSEKVFRYVMEGGENGLEKGFPSLMDSISSVNGSIKDGFDFGLSTISPSQKSTVEKNGNGVTTQDIVINLTTEMDGAILARKTYRYNQRENNLRGSSLVEVFG